MTLKSILMLIVASLQALPCASATADDRADKMTSTLIEAKEKKKEMVVRLRDGRATHGYIVDVAKEQFSIRERPGKFTIEVRYADVASLKGRHSVLIGFSKLGRGSVKAMKVAVGASFWVVGQGISFLLHGEPMPKC